jgi:mitogen-activated protein kinase kinase
LEIKDIVHRDIKPSNMLINKNAVVKLCGFDIARTFSERKFEEDCILGTANYMPLTLTHNIQDDMWAFGISLLEIINGKNPFADWDSYGQAFGILRWVPSVPATISVDMHELILQL